jgi:hypothetical protein
MPVNTLTTQSHAHACIHIHVHMSWRREKQTSSFDTQYTYVPFRHVAERQTKQ